MTSSKLAEITIYRGAIQKYKELLWLIDFLKEREKPSRILEIGTASGGTFWLWCELALQNAHIISIDLPHGRFGNGNTFNKKVLSAYKKPLQIVDFIRKDSQSAKSESLLQKYISNEKLDILFIDGDHSYEGVKADFEKYRAYVKPNGIIIFHDIVKHDVIQECQVDQFWDELRNQFETYEFIDPETDDRGWGNWGGLGVLINKITH